MGKKYDCGDDEDNSKKKTIRKKEFIVRKPKVCSSQKDLFDKIMECSKKDEEKRPPKKDPCDPRPIEPCKTEQALADPCRITKPPEPPKPSDCLAKTVVEKNPCKDEKAGAIEKLKATSLDKINESGKKIQEMKKKFKEMDKKPKLSKAAGMFKSLDIAGFFKRLTGSMSGKGSGPAAGAPGRPMKYPYTFSAKFAQFPIKFYAKNQWIWKYYFVSVAVCIPLFYSISNLANSPGNVAKWAEIRRKEAMEHH